MIRNLKVLGLTLVAAFAMSAIVASAAMANKEFKSPESSGTTWLTGEQHGANLDVFKTDGGQVTCTGATYSGSATGTSVASVTLAPTYSGCHLVLIFTFNVTIDMNGCAYVFTVEAGANANNEGEVDIECPPGAVIEVTAPSCTVTVPAQTGLKTITYTNSGKNEAKRMDITADVNLTGITYEEHGGACATDTEHTTNGTYQGAATVRGYSSQTTHTEATQTSITVE